MAIEFKHGDILTSTADIICQQVNCKGVMGSGLAKQIRAKYPQVYTKYKELIDTFNHTGERFLGQMQLVEGDKGKWIANCFGQESYGYNGTYTDLSALRDALVQVGIFAGERILCGHRCNIAISYNIGAGLGGANPDDIHEMLGDLFHDYPGVVELWIYEK